MIISIETLTSMDEFKGVKPNILSMKLQAIENLIRSYTNNNFQCRKMRIEAPIINNAIVGSCPYFKVGDTIQISKSLVNDGLYEILDIEDGKITLDSAVYDNPLNLITKIIYPSDIQKGVVDLMLWEQENRHKVGIKSETVSRHQVTYYDQDADNQVMGYPVSLLGFLSPYVKARF